MSRHSSDDHPVKQLIYRSRATVEFSDAELLDLLDTARARNHALGISGVLLFQHGTFVQVIEGEPEVINAVFDRIQSDRRHHDLEVMACREHTERRFTGWSMAFERVENTDELPPGHDDFLENGFVSFAGRDPDEIAEILLGFVRDRIDAT